MMKNKLLAFTWVRQHSKRETELLLESMKNTLAAVKVHVKTKQGYWQGVPACKEILYSFSKPHPDPRKGQNKAFLSVNNENLSQLFSVS